MYIVYISTCCDLSRKWAPYKYQHLSLNGKSMEDPKNVTCRTVRKSTGCWYAGWATLLTRRVVRCSRMGSRVNAPRVSTVNLTTVNDVGWRLGMRKRLSLRWCHVRITVTADGTFRFRTTTSNRGASHSGSVETPRSFFIFTGKISPINASFLCVNSARTNDARFHNKTGTASKKERCLSLSVKRKR